MSVWIGTKFFTWKSFLSFSALKKTSYESCTHVWWSKPKAEGPQIWKIQDKQCELLLHILKSVWFLRMHVNRIEDFFFLFFMYEPCSYMGEVRSLLYAEHELDTVSETLVLVRNIWRWISAWWDRWGRSSVCAWSRMACALLSSLLWLEAAQGHSRFA